jgi:hypothetical protein
MRHAGVELAKAGQVHRIAESSRRRYSEMDGRKTAADS